LLKIFVFRRSSKTFPSTAQVTKKQGRKLPFRKVFHRFFHRVVEKFRKAKVLL